MAFFGKSSAVRAPIGRSSVPNSQPAMAPKRSLFQKAFAPSTAPVSRSSSASTSLSNRSAVGGSWGAAPSVGRNFAAALANTPMSTTGRVFGRQPAGTSALGIDPLLGPSSQAGANAMRFLTGAAANAQANAPKLNLINRIFGGSANAPGGALNPNNPNNLIAPLNPNNALSTFPGAANNVLPFPQAPYQAPGGGGGGDSGGGGGGGGGYGADGGGDDNYGSESQGPDYGGDDGTEADDSGPITSDSGGYSEQGGGGPADTYASDQDAIRQTEHFSPRDAPGQDSDYGQAEGAGYDHDDDEDAGGQDMYAVAPSEADAGPDESWNWRDRPRPTVPEHMYTSPRHRPGGEEGDDDMDATGYIAALEDYDAPGMGGFSDFAKDLGKSLGVTALNSATKALGGPAAGKTVTVAPPPPMSTAAKIGLAIAVAIPVGYLLLKSRAPTPAVATNPRRRRRRR